MSRRGGAPAWEGMNLRRAWLGAFVSIVFVGASCVSSSLARAEDRPPRIEQLGDWRRQHPEHARGGREAWQPEDVVEFMKRYPEAVLHLGVYNGRPPGNTEWRDVGRRVTALRAIAESSGVDLGNRVCATFRFDVERPNSPRQVSCDPGRGGSGCDWEGRMDGRFGERETVVKTSGLATGGDPKSLRHAKARWMPDRWRHRLVVLRPGASDEEQRRIVANSRDVLGVDRVWQAPPRAGDAYEVRGSFDPRWIQLVPREVHRGTLERLWTGRRDVCPLPSGCRPPAQPLDPLDPDNQRGWARGIDRAEIERLATEAQVPALYGFVRDQGAEPKQFEDPYFTVSGVVMRVGDPDYQHWALSRTLYQLEDQGFEPGKPACLIFAYKPGWHTYYDEKQYGTRNATCAVPGAHMWLGPAHPCRPKRTGGLFHPTQFGPGAYEAAVNQFILKLFDELDNAGYRDVQLITVERPRFRDRYWSILSKTVRSHPNVVGELRGSIVPTLSSLRRKPDSPDSSPADP